MKILHTADWHIGQLFYEYDRTFEHQQFLCWLVETLQSEQADVLLISGDVFDLANPSAASVKLFYTFLDQATQSNPLLQIVITAGNHDSAARLESPKPLLKSSNIHIIGLIEKDETGNIDFDQLTIPLKDKNGEIKAWCLAVPFLRAGDYPVILGCDNPYAEGVAAFYKGAYEYVLRKKQKGQSILAMGHLHAQHAEVTELDKTERLILGGIECISAAAFHPNLVYVALGHIHKAQHIGGKKHIRYCGSPLPMSFSERKYKHQVIVVEIENEILKDIETIEIPVTIPVISIPQEHTSIDVVLTELAKLPDAEESLETAPYLEVRILEDRPDPSRNHKIRQAIQGKNVRLASINMKTVRQKALAQKNSETQQKLDELDPADIFSKIYESSYGTVVPHEMLQLFNKIALEVKQTNLE